MIEKAITFCYFSAIFEENLKNDVYDYASEVYFPDKVFNHL